MGVAAGGRAFASSEFAISRLFVGRRAMEDEAPLLPEKEELNGIPIVSMPIASSAQPRKLLKDAARRGTGEGKRRVERSRRKGRSASSAIEKASGGGDVEMVAFAVSAACANGLQNGDGSCATGSRETPSVSSASEATAFRARHRELPAQAGLHAHKDRASRPFRRVLLMCRELTGIGMLAAPIAIQEAGFLGAMLSLVAAGILIWMATFCLLYTQGILVTASVSTSASSSPASYANGFPCVTLLTSALWGSSWGNAVILLEAAFEWSVCASCFGECGPAPLFTTCMHVLMSRTDEVRVTESSDGMHVRAALLAGTLEDLTPRINALEAILISVQLVCMLSFVRCLYQRLPLLPLSDLLLLSAAALLLLSISPHATLPFTAAANATSPPALPPLVNHSSTSTLPPSPISSSAPASSTSPLPPSPSSSTEHRAHHANASRPLAHPWRAMALASSAALSAEGLLQIKPRGLPVACAIWMSALSGFPRILILTSSAAREAIGGLEEGGGEGMASFQSSWSDQHPHVARGVLAACVNIGRGMIKWERRSRGGWVGVGEGRVLKREGQFH